MRTVFIRTKYLTGGKTQFKYLSLLIASIVIPTIFVSACLYYIIFTIMAEQLGIPEYIAYNLIPVINKINYILLVGVPPLFLLLVLWGVVLSHRLTGPITRLQKELKAISQKGDFKKRIKVRKYDDIKSLVDEINLLLESLEKCR